MQFDYYIALGTMFIVPFPEYCILNAETKIFFATISVERVENLDGVYASGDCLFA
jgi:hypothetical protein